MTTHESPLTPKPGATPDDARAIAARLERADRARAAERHLDALYAAITTPDTTETDTR